MFACGKLSSCELEVRSSRTCAFKVGLGLFVLSGSFRCVVLLFQPSTFGYLRPEVGALTGEQEPGCFKSCHRHIL